MSKVEEHLVTRQPLLPQSTTNTTKRSNKLDYKVVGDHQRRNNMVVGVSQDSTMRRSPTKRLDHLEDDDQNSSKLVESPSGSAVTSRTQRKHGGWKSMPYIIGNETFERLASFGLLSNFMVYLLREYHLDQVFATNINNIWSGTGNFTPLLGAFISDAYLGKFRTIAFASIASALGMVALTLTSLIHQLRPPSCTAQQLDAEQCVAPSNGQLGFLYITLALLTIGTSGIRPCSVPFGVDQFDQKTEEGRKGVDSFFNWYFFTYTIVIMVSLTVIIYIQDSISWTIGFGIPTILMFCAIFLFFLGTRVYVYVPPGGSLLTGIVKVFVCAYKNRNLKLPSNAEETQGVLYDPPVPEHVLAKLSLTNQYRWLNKAAIIVEGKINADGSVSNQPKVCSIQQVEEVKCLIRITPIWASTIIFYIIMGQSGSFNISQAIHMDRHLGHKFQIPAGSLLIFSMLTITIFIPIYDRLLVPALRKITKHESGITVLQRIGTGMVFAVLSMILAAFIETKRREGAINHILWLVPQHILMGFAEAFAIIGQLEFCNKQFPDHMRSIGNSIFSLNSAVASYLSTVLVTIVHSKTGKHGRPDWLYKNINLGKLDYYYYLIAVLGVINFIFYLFVAHRFRYKAIVPDGREDMDEIELRSTKHVDP